MSVLPLAAADLHSRAVAHRIDECGNLISQRIALIETAFVIGDLWNAGKRLARTQAMDPQPAVVKVDDDVGFIREDAHLALGLGTDPARREVADGTVLELDARIGNVDRAR